MRRTTINTPLVSVIIPIYNVEKYLKECLDSVINQTYKNLEIILVDDKSPDNSGKIADEYAKKDKRIKVVHKPKNEGPSKARNIGLSYATGVFVAFIDSDDFVDLDWFEVLERESKNSDSDTTRGYIKIHIEDERAIKAFGSREAYEGYYNNTIKVLTQKNKNNMRSSVCFSLYKKSVIDEYGIKFNDNIKSGEDELWNLIFSYFANKVTTVNRRVYYHRRIRRGSIMTTKDTINNNESFYRALLFHEIVKFMNSKDDYPQDIYINRFFDMYSMISKILHDTSNEDILNKIAKQMSTISIKYKSNILKELIYRKNSDESKMVHLVGQLAEKENQITQLRVELASHLSIKRSAKLTIGNIKRRLKYGKNRDKQ